jgi:licheninase
MQPKVRIAVAAAMVASGVLAVDKLVPLALAGPDDANCPNTAAQSLNWGQPNRSDGFNDPASLAGWKIYDSPGHNGNGRRTPDAVSVADGHLSIVADAKGNTGGMAWNPGQTHGRWEVCVRSLPAAETYHSVALLWPDAEDWPSGGEVDFMEIVDPHRQFVEGFLHYGPDNQLEQGGIAINATEWHAWAVEWTADRLVYFVDGRPWWETRNVDHLPPRAMHLCIQLDNFGGDTSAGGRTEVDWARQYSL